MMVRDVIRISSRDFPGGPWLMLPVQFFFFFFIADFHFLLSDFFFKRVNQKKKLYSKYFA